MARQDMAAVNAELGPWIKMTVPAPWHHRPIVQWPTETALFNSWILLFGVLPIDKHRFYLHSTNKATGFDERSTSIINKRWQHTRTAHPGNYGCTLTDTVTFESRLPFVAALLTPVYRLVFQRRHHYLRRCYAMRR